MKTSDQYAEACRAVSGVSPDWFAGPRQAVINALRKKGMRKKDAVFVCAVGACAERGVLNTEMLEHHILHGESI